MKGPREHFSDFLKRLTKAVQIGIVDPEARWVLSESLAMENSNLECKEIIEPLKIRSPPMNEWILHTPILSIHWVFWVYTERWVGEVISKVIKRH